MSVSRTKRTSLTGRPKGSASHSTDVATSLPHFKPPSTTQQHPSTTTPTALPSFVQPTSAALSDEATKMQQRLHALRATMEEDKRQREERNKQRKAKSHLQPTDEQPLSQKEYLKQLQARLEAKKAATKEKVRQVKVAMDKASEYVAPLGHGQRLALFERVSEEWLKDGDDGKQAEAEEGGVAVSGNGVSPVEESKEAVGYDAEDDAVVIVAAEDEVQDREAEGHAEFVKAREEWLQSLQQPAGATPAHSSRPVTASSSTTTSAISSTPMVRPIPSTSVSASSSLLVGVDFDESASAASFQEARQAWLESVAAKPRTTTTPNTTSPLLTAQSAPHTAERLSCYQCYRLFVAGEGKAGGESGREMCGAECVAALERVERLRRERARSMRAMEQRILALQHEQQQQLAAQHQQQQTTQVEEDDEKEEVVQSEGPSSAVVPSLALPSGAVAAVVNLPVSACRFTASDEQPEPVIEFPSA